MPNHGPSLEHNEADYPWLAAAALTFLLAYVWLTFVLEFHSPAAQPYPARQGGVVETITGW